MSAALDSVRETLAAIALYHPFWSALLLRLAVRMDDSIPTAGTDGKALIVNPVFWDALPPKQQFGVLAHEAGHLIYGHPWRRGSRDPHTWNLAADIHANELVRPLRWAALPEGAVTALSMCGMLGVQDPADLLGESTEAIYERIMHAGGAQHAGCNGNGRCTLRDAPGAGTMEGESAHAAMREAVVAAARSGASQGDVPGALEPWIAELSAPPAVDWRAVLARFASERIPSDYDWRMPARRWAACGLYLPSLVSEDALSHIVLAVDTSGSIDGERLASMLGACLDCARNVRARRVTLLLWETSVYAEHDLTDADTLPSLAVQRGGTDVRAVFNYVDRNESAPACIIVLTDLETPFPDAAPAYPVLWLTDRSDSATAPWGETLSTGGAP